MDTLYGEKKVTTKVKFIADIDTPTTANIPSLNSKTDTTIDTTV